MKPPNKKALTDWPRPLIKYKLEMRGWNWARIAREHGYTCKSTPADVMRKPYPGMERIVARLIGVHPMMIWPSRYDADGNSLHGRRRSKAVK